MGIGSRIGSSLQKILPPSIRYFIPGKQSSTSWKVMCHDEPSPGYRDDEFQKPIVIPQRFQFPGVKRAKDLFGEALLPH
jgi:hypothetical protein